MSSAEAEYVSLSTYCAQVLWMRTQLTDYGFYFDKIPMYCDSKAAIAISCNPVQHSRTKHIDFRYHFIKEKVEKGIIELFFVRTEHQLADLFTKAFSEERIKYLVKRLEGHTCRSRDDIIEHTVKLMDIVQPTPYDSPLTGGYILESDKGRLKLEKLMNLCIILSNRVTTLKNELSSTKAVCHKAFITLTKRVKRLETQLKQKRSRPVIHSSDKEEPSMDIKDSPKHGRMIKELDKDEDVNLVSEQGEVHETAELLKDDDDATLAQTLLNIKRSTTKDKGKGIMQETELPKKIKKREMIQLSLDEELAQRTSKGDNKTRTGKVQS
nr:ribonuclease H [Tanacetum cinerariifolium]